MIFILATKRSGHHAFVEWVCNGIEGGWNYFNNCGFIDQEIRFLEQRSSDNNDFSSPLTKSTIHKFVYPTVFSFENKTKEYFLNNFIFNTVAEAGDDVKTVVFLRDPFNSFSSLCKYVESNPNKSNQIHAFISSWISLSREFLDEGSESQFVPVFYNEFLVNEHYRENIANILGIKNNAINDGLSTFGGGGNTMFGDAKTYLPSIEILESRWEKLKAPEDFGFYLSDEFVSAAKVFCESVGRLDLFDEPMNNFIS